MTVPARLAAFVLLVCGFGAIFQGDWLMVAELAAVPLVAIGGAIALSRICRQPPPPMHRRKG